MTDETSGPATLVNGGVQNAGSADLVRDPAADPLPAVVQSRLPNLAGRRTAWRIVEGYALPTAFLIMIVVYSLARPNTFASIANVQSILGNQAVVAVAALALIVPLVGGRFDLSVGSVVTVSATVTASAMSKYKLSLPVAILLALLFCAAIGVIVGFLVARLGINSLVATLGASTLLDGLVQLYTGGIPISSRLSPHLLSLSSDKVLGVPTIFLVMAAVAIVVWYLLMQTPYGRRLASVGSNAEAARLVGLPVAGTVWISFIVAAVLAGITGVLSVAEQGSANPSVGGIPFLLPALAAVFLGSTTIRPGRYNVPGALIALYFVGTNVSGLTLLGEGAWVEPVFVGSAVVVAVALSTFARRRRTGVSTLGA
jgi:ribose transport system permease protein